ncbi:MAG: flagellar biosynthesis protein FlhB [Oscillospiraceae bacterium]|nr:flagellar biosynthesis protein FlhB [Oscillospiraceae bacterium]
MAPPGASGEKTERATPKKREETRKKGQVLKSTEVNTAVTMVAMFAALSLFGVSIFQSMAEMLTDYLGTRLGEKLTPQNVSLVFDDAIFTLLRAAMPLLLVAVAAGVVINLVQVGFLLTGATLRPKFSKLNPLQGMKRIFSMRSLVEMIKAVLKIALVGFVVYSEYKRQFLIFPNLTDYGVDRSGREIFSLCLGVGFRAAVALVGIGVADYMFQWFDFEKNLRMTKQEVKDEYKMIEGDPQIKGKIKQKQREMAAMRMMRAVPEADVVITNPTHYAVAIKYDEAVASAPVVLAKGADKMALRIREKARLSGVQIVENKPVARALYETVEVGRQIPAALFQAVAEILARVYQAAEGN